MLDQGRIQVLTGYRFLSLPVDVHDAIMLINIGDS